MENDNLSSLIPVNAIIAWSSFADQHQQYVLWFLLEGLQNNFAIDISHKINSLDTEAYERKNMCNY